MTHPTLPFNPVSKDRWFYDQFEYCIGFQLDEINALRVLNHASINDTIDRRLAWREMARQRWASNGIPENKHRYWRDITDKTVQDLHKLADVLLDTKSKYKLIFGLHQGYIYTNDLDLLDRLAGMAELTDKTYSRAEINRPKNTVRLNKSQYSYRSYFKYSRIDLEKKQQIANFLKNQCDHMRLAPSLKRWVDEDQYTSCQDYFFVDYNNSSWITMLNLIHPGLVRKTLHIIPATK